MVAAVLLYLFIISVSGISGRHHHHHHHNFNQHSQYFPVDFNFHKSKEILLGLHDFDQTQEEKLSSSKIIEMLEEDIERQKIQHHKIRHQAKVLHSDIHWPVKKEAEVDGDIVLGGLMMVHEREDSITCGPIMPQGGIQALEAMLYTLDRINADPNLLPNITIGAHILDDCDKDTYGLEIAVDFIKGKSVFNILLF